MLHIKSNTITWQDVESALEVSNESLGKLDALMQQAKQQGHPSKELTQQIDALDKECDRLLEQYLEQYRLYHSQ